jgi:hypothetical protein
MHVSSYETCILLCNRVWYLLIREYHVSLSSLLRCFCNGLSIPYLTRMLSSIYRGFFYVLKGLLFISFVIEQMLVSLLINREYFVFCFRNNICYFAQQGRDLFSVCSLLYFKFENCLLYFSNSSSAHFNWICISWVWLLCEQITLFCRFLHLVSSWL